MAEAVDVSAVRTPIGKGVNERRDVKMSPEEVEVFLRQERTTTLCSHHPDGSIHAVAMWYAFLDGNLAVWTKRKSQKVQNLRRDPRLTFLVEAGDRDEELRGVEIVGQGRLVENLDAIWQFGVSMWERHIGRYSDEQRPVLEAKMHNRLVVVIHPTKLVSWDHRKLGTAAVSSLA
jgi:PPOX class probable F420-dependent enzyme